MARRTERMAEDAAREAALASEAGRVLQQRAQEKVSEKVELKTEPKLEPPPETGDHRPVKAYNKRRDEAMAQIEEREEREAGRAPPPEEPKFEEPPNKTEPKPKAAVEPAPEPETAPEPEPAPEPKMVKVKVDGEEFEVSQEEIDEAGGVAPYRILKASENRLKKANEIVAKLQAEVAARAMPPVPPAPPPPTIDQIIASKHDDLRYGTPEQFQAAMREVLMAMAPQQINPALIATQAQTQTAFQMAQMQFFKEFGDVLANPDLADLAKMKMQRVLAPHVTQQGPDWQKLSSVDFPSEFAKIGSQLKSLLPPRPSQPQQETKTKDTPSPTSEREARKSSITVLPTAAARAASKEEVPLTPEQARRQILEEAARSRGKYVG